MTTVANSLALKDIINPQFHQNNFPAELYVKSQLGIKLDKGQFDLSQTFVSTDAML